MRNRSTIFILKRAVTKLSLTALICVLLFSVASCNNTEDICADDLGADDIDETDGDNAGETLIDWDFVSDIMRIGVNVDRMIFYVGEQKEFNIDMQYNGILEFRVTEADVVAKDNIIHNNEIAAVDKNKITLHKSGRYKLWAIVGNPTHNFYYYIRGIDTDEMKTEIRTSSEFETTLHFYEQVNQGEEIPYVIRNKNVSGETIVKVMGYADPNSGTPGIEIYTLIDGYKLYLSGIYACATVMSTYVYAPGQIYTGIKNIEPVVYRSQVIRLSDGKSLAEDDPFLETLGFASSLTSEEYEENKRIRDALWEELKTKYDPGDPAYNWEWNEIYHDYPIYNPQYTTITAPKGVYHIELSTGEMIENAFEIV